MSLSLETRMLLPSGNDTGDPLPLILVLLLPTSTQCAQYRKLCSNHCTESPARGTALHEGRHAASQYTLDSSATDRSGCQ